MKALIIAIIICLPAFCYGQIEMKNDTLTVNGQAITKGKKLKLGRPVNDRDFFTYVTAGKTSSQIQRANDAIKGTETSNGFGKDYSGRFVIVKKIVKDGNEEFGYKYFVVVKTSGLMNAWIDIENALATKELIIE